MYAARGCTNIDREWKLSMRCLSSKTRFFREGDSRVRDATKAPGFPSFAARGKYRGEITYTNATANHLPAIRGVQLVDYTYLQNVSLPRIAIIPREFFTSLTSSREHLILIDANVVCVARNRGTVYYDKLFILPNERYFRQKDTFLSRFVPRARNVHMHDIIVYVGNSSDMSAEASAIGAQWWFYQSYILK